MSVGSLTSGIRRSDKDDVQRTYPRERQDVTNARAPHSPPLTVADVIKTAAGTQTNNQKLVMTCGKIALFNVTNDTDNFSNGKSYLKEQKL